MVVHQRNSWQTEADNTDPAIIEKIINRNAPVENFLVNKEKFFVIASKGVGKTLLLKFKRFIIENEYNKDQERSLIFIPQSTPYLDFISDLGELSKEHIRLLSKLQYARKIWKIAIIISALSHYYYMSIDDLTQYLNEIEALCKKHNNRYKEFISYSQGHHPYNPSFIFAKILELSFNNLNIFLNEYYLLFECILRAIHSGIIIFIDRLDQALKNIEDEDVWINCQAGLIEASWDIMRINKHIKVYTSMRIEAYLRHHSSDKAAISASITELTYSKNDLENLLDKQVRYYESKNSLSDFLGFKIIRNLHSNTDEKVFNYILRHTLRRPRDLIVICAKLSQFANEINEDQFREIVNSASSADIINNSFDEVSSLLHSIRSTENRERFLSLINTNILTLDELKDICRQFNNKPQCSTNNCKKCMEFHPFCDLYNIGLLGILKRDMHGGDPFKEYKMKFLGPYDKHSFCKGSLEKSEGEYYLIHPSLHNYIKDLRNRLVGEDYNLVDHILVGHNYTWTKRCSYLMDIHNIIKTIQNSDIASSLKIEINNILDPEGSIQAKEGHLVKIKRMISVASEYSDQLTKVIGFLEKIIQVSIRLTNGFT